VEWAGGSTGEREPFLFGAHNYFIANSNKANGRARSIKEPRFEEVVWILADS